MSLFAKNLLYPPMVSDPKSRWEDAAFVAPIIGRFGVQAYTELLLMHVHAEMGMTYVVQKAITDELQQCDFAADTHFENLPWPAKTIEFNFADPELGTILVGHLLRDDLRAVSETLNVALIGHAAESTHTHELIVVAHCADRSGSCIIVHDENTWTRMLAGERAEMALAGPTDGHMNKVETDSLLELTLLCFKVLAYSSIPQFKPQPVSRNQLYRGEGKPGVLGRPARPTFRTVYLPHVVRPTAPAEPVEGQAPEIHREFKGRRGHIRWFHSDFYVNMKGKWIYVPPVIVEGQHLIAKVRKPV